MQEAPHLRLVHRPGILAGRPGLLQELHGHVVGTRPPSAGHAHRPEPQDEDVVELLPLHRVHRHHPHGARGLGRGDLVLGQPGLGDGRQVAREVARGGTRLAADEAGR